MKAVSIVKSIEWSFDKQFGSVIRLISFHVPVWYGDWKWLWNEGRIKFEGGNDKDDSVRLVGGNGQFEW